VGECDAIDDEFTEGEDDETETMTSSCDCPPGIMACTCADGSNGSPSTAGATAAGPGMFRSVYGY